MESLVRRRYVIAVMNMPLTGWNPRPIVHLARYGTLVFTSHDMLSLLPGRRGRALKLFLDPVVVAVNVSRKLGFGAAEMSDCQVVAGQPRSALRWLRGSDVPMTLRDPSHYICVPNSRLRGS